MAKKTTTTVHVYDNDFPAEALPRGFHRGKWRGHFVVTDAGIHVATDVGLEGEARVVLEVTNETVSVMLDLSGPTGDVEMPERVERPRRYSVCIPVHPDAPLQSATFSYFCALTKSGGLGTTDDGRKAWSSECYETAQTVVNFLLAYGHAADAYVCDYPR